MTENASAARLADLLHTALDDERIMLPAHALARLRRRFIELAELGLRPMTKLRPEDIGWRGDVGELVVAALVASDEAADRVARLLRSAEPAWFASAACRRPEHACVRFHPERGQSARPALEVCSSCFVVDDCFPALVGILGNTTARQRAAMRARGAA